MTFDDHCRNHAARLLLAGAVLALVAGCSRDAAPPSPADAPSLVLVTFGHVPDGAFVETNANIQTPSFARLAEEPGVRRVLAQQPPFDAAATAAALRKRGYATAAYLADPALAARMGTAFATSAVPSRIRPVPLRLVPSPFEHPRHEGFAHGDAIVDAGLAWLASEAGLPAPSAMRSERRRSADKADQAATKPVEPCLKRPVFLWLHLADPIFRGTPEQIRVGGSAPLVNPEVAFMDLQLGRVLEFIAKNGLADHVRLASACLQGEPVSESEAASGNWAARPLPALVPEAFADVLPVSEATEASSTAINIHESLAFRLRHLSGVDAAALVADCEAWRDTHPTEAEAWCWLGVAQAHAKEFASAVEAHAKALALEPESPFRMSNLGLAYLAVGDIAKAIDNLENAYLANPDGARHRATLAAVLLHAGIAFSEQESHSEAMACLSRVVYLQPRNPQAYFAIGKENEKLQRPDLARANYLKALDINPRFQPAREALRELDKTK